MQGKLEQRGRFVGIDLAWAVDTRHTGVAVAEGDLHGLRLIKLSSNLRSLDDVVGYVASELAENMVIAIDASLIVENDLGQRPCEAEIGRTFGRFGASCHSTNRQRAHWNTGVRLVNRLKRYGFRHGLPLHTARGRRGHWLVEVYPHPAMVRLFNLMRIVPYKKGSVDRRRRGLGMLQRYLRGFASQGDGLKGSVILDELLDIDLATRKGAALKEYEDLLDAAFCGYLAWYCWRWGGDKNEAFGNLQTGYIVVPKLPTAYGG